MAIQVDIRTRSAHGKVQQIIGKLIFSGNYPAGGEPLPMNTFAQVSTNPLTAIVVGASQNNKYLYDDNNQKLIVRTGAAPPVEITAGAYPASVTSDNVEFNFVFNKF